MLNVALTGNVASGKSTVAALFVRWGASLIDSDALVAEAQQPGSETLSALAREFGDQIITADGSLDRAALRSLAFANPDVTEKLNSIVHPAVKARREELLTEARARGDQIVVSDIPLLFEVLDPSGFDLVILVHAPDEVRRKRLLDRGLSSEEAERLMSSQMPSEQKRSLADIVIDNEGLFDELERTAAEAWKEIRSQLDS
jgi:dephospho-CoA kinase